MCMFVCMSVHRHTLKTTTFSAHVSCDHDSVLCGGVAICCALLFFLDDVMFLIMGPMVQAMEVRCNLMFTWHYLKPSHRGPHRTSVSGLCCAIIALFVTSLTRPSGHGGWPGWVHQLWRSTVKSVIRLIVFVCWHFMQTVLLLLLLSYYSATLTLGGIALSALCCCDMTSIRLKCW